MRRVTDADLALDDVVIEIHPDRLHLNVHKKVEDALRMYGECRYIEKTGKLQFRVAGYQYRDCVKPLMETEACQDLEQRMPRFFCLLQERVYAGESREAILADCRKARNMNPGLFGTIDLAIDGLAREQREKEQSNKKEASVALQLQA